MMLIKRIIREYSMEIKIGYNDKNNNDENFNYFTGYNDLKINMRIMMMKMMKKIIIIIIIIDHIYV